MTQLYHAGQKLVVWSLLGSAIWQQSAIDETRY